MGKLNKQMRASSNNRMWLTPVAVRNSHVLSILTLHKQISDPTFQKTLDIGKPLACRERRRRLPPSWNGLALLSLLSNLPPLSYDGLSHTSRTFRKKIANLTPLEKMDSPNFPTCHPSTNGLGRTPRTFRKKFPNLTPLVKMDSPYCHYFPTCHPSAIMDSATLVGDALSQCNDGWQ